MSVLPIAHPQGSTRYARAYRVCPLCEAEDIEYEFVIDGVAFSGCRACRLLFANPAPVEVPPGVTIDVDPALAGFAERVLGRNAASRFRAGVDAATAAAKHDLVIAADVLDRVGDPVAVARALREKLGDDGVLLVTVPSVASSDARSQRERWPHFRSKVPWYYEVDTLQLVLSRAGFGSFVPLIDVRDCVASPSPALRRFFAGHLAIVCRPAPARGRPRLSVIVPVYNEAPTAAELLDQVVAKRIDGIDIEIVIVESNSTDGSREIVSAYADRPGVKLVLEERPRGKGHAVRTGLTHATGDVVLFQDADLEYDVNDYDQLVAPLFALRRNFVLGSRHGAAGEGWKIRRFEERKIVSTVLNVAHVALLTMFNTLYGQSLFDPFTMYKVFRRDCLAGLTFECDRFDFDYEINIKLIRKGYHPFEIPVNYRSRSFSEGKKVAFLSDPPTWIRAMLRHRRSPLYRF
jgi:hypothetical protein